jgi:hypothetical protein
MKVRIAYPLVADDPQRPLDPRGPQFAQKQAQRYRQWVR